MPGDAYVEQCRTKEWGRLTRISANKVREYTGFADVQCYMAGVPRECPDYCPDQAMVLFRQTAIWEGVDVALRGFIREGWWHRLQSRGGRRATIFFAWHWKVRVDGSTNPASCLVSYRLDNLLSMEELPTPQPIENDNLRVRLDTSALQQSAPCRFLGLELPNGLPELDPARWPVESTRGAALAHFVWEGVSCYGREDEPDSGQRKPHRVTVSLKNVLSDSRSIPGNPFVRCEVSLVFTPRFMDLLAEKKGKDVIKFRGAPKADGDEFEVVPSLPLDGRDLQDYKFYWTLPNSGRCLQRSAREIMKAKPEELEQSSLDWDPIHDYKKTARRCRYVFVGWLSEQPELFDEFLESPGTYADERWMKMGKVVTPADELTPCWWMVEPNRSHSEPVQLVRKSLAQLKWELPRYTGTWRDLYNEHRRCLASNKQVDWEMIRSQKFPLMHPIAFRAEVAIAQKHIDTTTAESEQRRALALAAQARVDDRRAALGAFRQQLYRDSPADVPQAAIDIGAACLMLPGSIKQILAGGEHEQSWPHLESVRRVVLDEIQEVQSETWSCEERCLVAKAIMANQPCFPYNEVGSFQGASKVLVEHLHGARILLDVSCYMRPVQVVPSSFAPVLRSSELGERPAKRQRRSDGADVALLESYYSRHHSLRHLRLEQYITYFAVGSGTEDAIKQALQSKLQALQPNDLPARGALEDVASPQALAEPAPRHFDAWAHEQQEGSPFPGNVVRRPDEALAVCCASVASQEATRRETREMQYEARLLRALPWNYLGSKADLQRPVSDATKAGSQSRSFGGCRLQAALPTAKEVGCDLKPVELCFTPDGVNARSFEELCKHLEAEYRSVACECCVLLDSSKCFDCEDAVGFHRCRATGAGPKRELSWRSGTLHEDFGRPPASEDMVMKRQRELLMGIGIEIGKDDPQAPCFNWLARPWEQGALKRILVGKLLRKVYRMPVRVAYNPDGANLLSSRARALAGSKSLIELSSALGSGEQLPPQQVLDEMLLALWEHRQATLGSSRNQSTPAADQANVAGTSYTGKPTTFVEPHLSSDDEGFRPDLFDDVYDRIRANGPSPPCSEEGDSS